MDFYQNSMIDHHRDPATDHSKPFNVISGIQ